MRIVVLLLLSLLALSAQTLLTLPRLLSPDFPLLLVLMWGIAFGPGHGVLACAVNGLLLDIVSSAPPGSNLLGLAAVAAIAPIGMQRLFERRLGESVVLAPLAALLYYIVQSVALAVSRHHVDWVGSFVWGWLPGMLANLLWSIPIFLVTDTVLNKIPRRALGISELRSLP